MAPPSTAPPSRDELVLRRMIRGARFALARALNVTPASRAAGVRTMLESHGKDRVAYWFQLVLAMGIATFGLVVGSTGVVIGAMLVSPLMGPIVEIGMGLVTGSPVIVLHAAGRTFMSVAVVVAGSALLSLTVPIHEVNAEILARTSPTLIDLYIATFCALAAAYTTARQSSATVSAAAGTSISIALVPPLCVVGWGLGSARLGVSRGAAMLFTANLGAIVLFSAVAFFLLAYDTVETASLETEIVTEGSRLQRLGLRLRGAFGSKYGPVLRLGMPLLFVAAIFVPLRRALGEVAWKVRVREQVERALADVPGAKDAVRSNVVVERDTVTLQLFVVGDAKKAAAIKADLAGRILSTTKVTPSIDVVAVPDLEALRVASQAVSSPVISRVAPIPEVRRELGEDVRPIWPTQSAGELVACALVVPEVGAARVVAVHFGPALGEAGRELLAQQLGERLGVEVAIEDHPLSLATFEASALQDVRFVAEVAARTDALVAAGEGHLCVTMPAPLPRAKPGDTAEVVRSLVDAQTARLPTSRTFAAPGSVPSVRISRERCAAPDGDAGAGDAGAGDARAR